MEVATIQIRLDYRENSVSTPFLPNGSRYNRRKSIYQFRILGLSKEVSTPFLPNGSRYVWKIL